MIREIENQQEMFPLVHLKVDWSIFVERGLLDMKWL